MCMESVRQKVELQTVVLQLPVVGGVEDVRYGPRPPEFLDQRGQSRHRGRAESEEAEDKEACGTHQPFFSPFPASESKRRGGDGLIPEAVTRPRSVGVVTRKYSTPVTRGHRDRRVERPPVNREDMLWLIRVPLKPDADPDPNLDLIAIPYRPDHQQPPPSTVPRMIDLVSCDSKLLRSWRKLSWLLRPPFKRSFSIRALRFRSLSRRGERRSCWSSSFRSFRLTLCTSRQPEELDRLGELRSMTERDRFRAPFPSPITPAYVKLASLQPREPEEELDEVGAACRSFRSCLAEMLAEEGRVEDLVNVEELLHHWSCLRSPAFVELVCSFYEQVCNELFTGSEEEEEEEEELLHDAI
ncbi:hypothetical protein B296_00024741 [Ensete ventricosum]|uniref:OVATE domain-containing protein n=1 Tax=Ensete ventricosum TaxID=4639 RepID=A0A427A461_ENSVE|nr:hypothetical protein B296_00024741 [Ensete ventricosum]